MWLTKCRVTAHEPIFYATREIGRLYETGRYLHNYALTYALGFVHGPFFNPDQVPRYRDDLTVLNDRQVYVSPAHPVDVHFQLATFKYGEEHLHVEMEQATRNTPSFGRAKEIAVDSQFECYIFSHNPITPPRWIRLGKWHSKALVAVEQVEVREKTGPFVCPVPLNPLDLPDAILRTFDIISMPPASLIANARLEGPFYDLGAGLGLPIGMRYGFPPAAPAKKGR